MIEKIIKAARLGGVEINKYFGKSIQSFQKSTTADFRTEADLASETVILEELKKDYPQFNYYAEESGYLDNGSEYTFVIDPLDGTNNFFLGISNFSVSIALQKNEETILGVVYAPLTDQLYFAEKGKGSFLNNENNRLRVNEITSLKEASFCYIAGYNSDRTPHEDLVKEVSKHEIKRMLNNWSPALDCCLLASGKVESIICNGNDIYDNVAGKLIIKEAGGIITDFDAKPEVDNNNYFVASNNLELHKKVLQICRQLRNLKM